MYTFHSDDIIEDASHLFQSREEAFDYLAWYHQNIPDSKHYDAHLRIDGEEHPKIRFRLLFGEPLKRQFYTWSTRGVKIIQEDEYIPSLKIYFNG